MRNQNIFGGFGDLLASVRQIARRPRQVRTGQHFVLPGEGFVTPGPYPVDINGNECPTASWFDGSHGRWQQRLNKRTGKCVREYSDADSGGGGGGE